MIFVLFRFYDKESYINILKMSVGFKDSITVSVKPHQIQFDTMNTNLNCAEISTKAANIPLFLRDK